MKQIIILLIFLFSVSVFADSSPAPQNFDELLRWAKSQKNSQQKINNERINRFTKEHNQQKQILEDAKKQLAEAKSLGKTLLENFDANEKLISELETKLHDKSGQLSELSGLSKQAGADLQSVLGQSLSSVDYPKQLSELKQLNADSRKVVSIDALETIWLSYLEHIKASGEINRFKANVTGIDGRQHKLDVIRAGQFNVYTNGQFLNYNTDTKQLEMLVRQPQSTYLSSISWFENSGSSVAETVIDPTRGMLLEMLIDTPTISERIDQGGWIGYIIIGIGMLGLIIILYRLTVLFVINRRVSKQLLSINKVNTDNPLGRILKIKSDNPAKNIEDLQMQIDEAILKELPDIEFGTGVIKLLSGVAPLLGLLGTVTGMILTFQSISLFGTGDPKLMASGISQALVTTMLGLIVAVPLLFGHALVSTRSRKIIQILDQQSAGLMVDIENE
ncbi:MAG: hypothetical protein D6B27_04520 [Gammaproteobacteria bacterium]|nr:MAG: hypothetical protein D6B27_04520 [Gammaproteobacteria bacterium]